jgi:uncharacterized lipoprotein YajG
MLNRLIFALAATFLLSGCCEVFGICTSVNVHTAIQPPYQLAGQSSQNSIQTEPTQAIASLSGQTDLLP